MEKKSSSANFVKHRNMASFILLVIVHKIHLKSKISFIVGKCSLIYTVLDKIRCSVTTKFT